MLKSAPILIAFCWGFQVFSQPGGYRFKTWDQQKGLPTNSSLNVIQDRKGYIWVSTMNGISRFNGINFREIGKHLNAQTIEGEIRAIIQDNDDVYWVASYENGLIKIDFTQRKENQIQVFNSSTLPEQICPPPQSINHLLDDDHGNIWIGTESNGLYRFNKKARTFVRWEFESPYSGFSGSIRCLYKKDDNMIWVGIVNGLVYINLATNVTTYPKTSYSTIYYAHPPTVRAICHWNKDTFAMATDRGAHFYLARLETFVPVYPPEDSADYKFLEYHDVIKFSKSELWFATTDRGIWFADVYAKKYSYSWNTDFQDEHIGRYPVYNLHIDRDEHIWVCHSKGLSYMNPQNARFKNIPFNFYVAQPPTKHFMIGGKHGVAIVRPDSLFVSTSPRSRPYARKLLHNGENIGGVQIWPHQKWGYIIVHPKGIFLADTLHERAIPALLVKDLPEAIKKSGTISQILVDTLDGAEQWWFAANETNLLYRFNWGNKQFIRYDIYREDSVGKKRGTHVTRILKDSIGGLWIATRDRGLFHLRDRTKNHFTQFSSGQAIENYLPGNYVADIVIDHKNQLWATVRGKGLVNIDRSNPYRLKYTVYGKERGLTYLSLDQLVVDATNNLWISSPNGLYVFDQGRKWFNYFGQSNGIRNPFLTLSSAKDSSAVLYFASTDYLVSIDANDFQIFESAASVQLLSLAVNERVVDITGKDRLELNPGENSIRFEFDVLDFDNPSGHYIMCKLDGFDKDWILLQDVFQQTYSSLPGGNYTFRLKEVKADGTRGDEILFELSINNFFYETSWFRFLVSALAAVLFFLAIRVHNVRKANKQKAILESRRALESERLRIAAELHDDVGGELSAIRLLSEMAQMNGSQNSLEQFGKISASSADLVQKMNEIVWALNVKNDSLQSLISYLNRYAVKFLDDVNITCKFIQPAEIIEYELDGTVRRNIFLFVKEALNNIVKHARATNVLISIEISDVFEITIHDNGRGFCPEKLTNTNGNGLLTMEKRAKDLQAKIFVGNEAGTIIRLRVPLRNTHTKV